MTTKASDYCKIYCLENTFKIKNTLTSQCIDWRRTKNESNFSLSVAGWSIGQLAVIFSVLDQELGEKFTFHERVYSAFLELVWWIENFSFHSDCHAWEEWIGCGHIKFLLTKSEEYNLSKYSVNYISELISKEKSAEMKVNILKWDHEENAVLLIDSNKYSIHPCDWESQFFIFTPAMVESMNKNIAEMLLKNFSDDFTKTSEELLKLLQDATMEHFFLTGHVLAWELPVYTISIDDESWEVTTIDQIAEKAKDLP